MTKDYILEKMKNSYQIEDKLTVYDHGIDVWVRTQEIINKLKNGNGEELPEFLIENKDLILSNLVDEKTLRLYCIYHDCGKPFCEPDN